MRVVAGMGMAGEGGRGRGAVEYWVDEQEEGKELGAGNGRQARFQALAAMEAVAIAGGPSPPRSSLLCPLPLSPLLLSLPLLFVLIRPAPPGTFEFHALAPLASSTLLSLHPVAWSLFSPICLYYTVLSYDIF